MSSGSGYFFFKANQSVAERQNLIVQTRALLSARPISATYSDVTFAVHRDHTFALEQIQSMMRNIHRAAGQDKKESISGYTRSTR